MWESFKKLDYADKFGIIVLVLACAATLTSFAIYVIQNGVK